MFGKDIKQINELFNNQKIRAWGGNAAGCGILSAGVFGFGK